MPTINQQTGEIQYNPGEQFAGGYAVRSSNGSYVLPTYRSDAVQAQYDQNGNQIGLGRISTGYGSDNPGDIANPPKPSVITSDNVRSATNDNISLLGTMTAPKLTAANGGASSQSSALDDAAKQLVEGAKGAPTGLDATYKEEASRTITKLNDLASSMDANSAAMMQSISNEFAGYEAQQQMANKAYEGGIGVEGMVSGRARYAPNIQSGILANAINWGISKLTEIRNKKSKALLEAEAARAAGQFQILDKKMSIVRQLAQDEKDTVQKTFENTMAAKEFVKKEMSDYASILAPAIVSSLTGNKEKDYKFISETALGTGGKVTPEYLYRAVTDYQNARRKAISDEQTNTIKEYNRAVSSGYKGSFLEYQLALKQATSGGVALYADSVLDKYNVPIDDPMRTVLGKLPPSTRNYYAQHYAEMYATKGPTAAARDLASIVFTTSSQADKDKFTLAASAIPRIDQILTKLETFKEAHPELGGIKNTLEYMKRAAQITNDQDFIDLASQIGLTQVEIRNKFFGSALTGTEQAIAKDFLVQFDKLAGDDVNNMITKMKSLRSTLEQNRNAIISSYAGYTPGEQMPSTEGKSTGNMIRVRLKSTGQTGTLPENEFDGSIYERI